MFRFFGRYEFILAWGIMAAAYAGHGDDAVHVYDAHNMVKMRLRNADGSFDGWVDPSSISNDGRPVRYFLRDAGGRMTGTGRAFRDGVGVPPAPAERPARDPAAVRNNPPAKPDPAPAREPERAPAKPREEPRAAPEKARAPARRPGDPPPKSEHINLDGDRPAPAKNDVRDPAPRPRAEPRSAPEVAKPAPTPDRSRDLEPLDPAKPRTQKLQGGGKVVDNEFVEVYAHRRAPDGSPVLDQDHTYLMRRSDFEREADPNGNGFGMHGRVPIFQRVYNEGTQTWDRVQQVSTARPTARVSDGKADVLFDRPPIRTAAVNEPEAKPTPTAAPPVAADSRKAEGPKGAEEKIAHTGSADSESAAMEKRFIGKQTAPRPGAPSEQQILDTQTLLVYSRAEYEAEARKGKNYRNLRPIGRLSNRDSQTYDPP